jgi:hypothetical protein
VRRMIHMYCSACKGMCTRSGVFAVLVNVPRIRCGLVLQGSETRRSTNHCSCTPLQRRSSGGGFSCFRFLISNASAGYEPPRAAGAYVALPTGGQAAPPFPWLNAAKFRLVRLAIHLQFSCNRN